MPNPHQNNTILIVDDTPESLFAMVRLFTSAGYNVLQAATGEEGKRLARLHLPDIILLDVVLPDMDGRELCQRMKHDDELAQCFIVLASNIKIASDEQAAGLECGADGYIALPVANRELLARVEAFIRIIKTEKLLRASEKRFADIFEYAPLGYQSLDSDGNFLLVNEAWTKTLGYTREEVIGHWFGEFLAPEYVDAYRTRFQIFKQQGHIHSEFEMIHKNGQRLNISFEGSIGYNSDNEFERTHCILQDITEQRQSEETIRASEERLRAMLDASPFPTLMVNLQNDNILYWSRSAQEMFGHAPTSTAEWYQLAYPDPDYLRVVLAQWKAATELARRSNQTVNSGEYWITCSDCSIRLCELYAAFLPDVIIITFNDITARRQAENKLTEQLAELHRWHHAMMGRELRTIELKREVNELLIKAGQPPRYSNIADEGGKE